MDHFASDLRLKTTHIPKRAEQSSGAGRGGHLEGLDGAAGGGSRLGRSSEGVPAVLVEGVQQVDVRRPPNEGLVLEAAGLHGSKRQPVSTLQRHW